MEELNTFEKTLPDKLDFLIKLKQFVSLEKNSLEKISLAVIFLELMQKNGKSAEIKKINGLEYVYENLTGYYFLVSSKKSGNCYDYIIKIRIIRLKTNNLPCFIPYTPLKNTVIIEISISGTPYYTSFSTKCQHIISKKLISFQNRYSRLAWTK